MSAKVIHADRIARVGGQFGKKPKGQKVYGEPFKFGVGYLGALGGAGAGVVVGGVPSRKQRKENVKQMRSNTGRMAANTRKIRQHANEQTFGKAKSPVHLITDVGTKAGRVRYSKPAPPQYKTFSRGTYIAGGAGAAGGAALTVRLPNKAKKDQEKTLARQRKKLTAQEELMRSAGIGKSAFFDVSKKSPKTKLIPKIDGVGRGKYVHAPRLRDKAKNPKWMANGVVNNPGSTLAVAGVGGGTLLLKDRKIQKSKDREKNVVGGALVGGGAAQLARVGADYGSKAVAERQFKPLTTKGNYGPYVEGPHKPALNKYKRTAKGDVRQKAKMFDENFPKGIPSYRARKVGVLLNRRGVAAGAVAGGAAVGAGAAGSRKVKKNLSPFGVEHA